MTARHKTPDWFYNLKTQVSFIVIVGLSFAAGLSFWTTAPLVKSLIDLAHDQRQVEMISDSRLLLGELYKTRKAFIEQQITQCIEQNKLQTCFISLDGESNIVSSIVKNETVSLPQEKFEWASESQLLVNFKETSWLVELNQKPIRPLGDEISKWLAAHEHLNLVIDKIQSSLIKTLSLSTLGGFLVSLLIVSLLSKKTRKQFSALRSYISLLAKGNGVSTVPDILKKRGDIALLAQDVHNMSQSLEAAQKKALENDRMQVWQTMARKVAHEIKNPITPIGLVGEQLAKTAEKTTDITIKKSLLESSKIIGEETASLNRMVKEFTAFARLPKPQLESTSMTNLIKDFIARNSDQELVSFDLFTSIEDDHVLVDPGMIRQVLHNLVNNSRLAKMPKSVSIRFALSKNQDYLFLDVSDDGPGVPESLKKTMFDAYVTSRSTGEKEKGMGLGLTITKQILMDHNGNIDLYSSNTQGTTMRIMLPVLKIGDERVCS